jgi:hypothetical protein
MLAVNVPTGKAFIFELNRERYHLRIAPSGAKQVPRVTWRHDERDVSGVKMAAMSIPIQMATHEIIRIASRGVQ